MSLGQIVKQMRCGDIYARDDPERKGALDAIGFDWKAKEGEDEAVEKTPKKPEKHPLEDCLTSFGMAMAEMNQLINLIDMARVGHHMTLERVAKVKVSIAD